jgi:hypothetical protein
MIYYNNIACADVEPNIFFLPSKHKECFNTCIKCSENFECFLYGKKINAQFGMFGGQRFYWSKYHEQKEKVI